MVKQILENYDFRDENNYQYIYLYINNVLIRLIITFSTKVITTITRIQLAYLIIGIRKFKALGISICKNKFISK